jgi:hypothetical protein
MANYAKGKYAQAVSDRSGQVFPYDEMVQEWNGAWVHFSEYEPKQPQLQPKPISADPQGLWRVRPARVEPPVPDFLPDNPFTTTASSSTLSISFPSGGLQAGTSHVRFQSVQEPVGGVAIATIQLTTTLNGAINSAVTTITLTDASAFPTSGFIMIEKILISTDAEVIADPLRIGDYENEVIQYTGKSGNQLTGCTRGTASPYRGVTLSNTTASSHITGSKVYGSYLATPVATTVTTTLMPPTETQYNSLTVSLVSSATSTATGGGFQCTIGPVNDKA